VGISVLLKFDALFKRRAALLFYRLELQQGRVHDYRIVRPPNGIFIQKVLPLKA
jgi:hypothetical protein